MLMYLFETHSTRPHWNKGVKPKNEKSRRNKLKKHLFI